MDRHDYVGRVNVRCTRTRETIGDMGHRTNRRDYVRHLDMWDTKWIGIWGTRDTKWIGMVM